MVQRITITLVGTIIVLAIAAALFKVYTAPERIQRRLEAARETCVKTGGEWATVGGRPVCKRG